MSRLRTTSPKLGTQTKPKARSSAVQSPAAPRRLLDPGRGRKLGHRWEGAERDEDRHNALVDVTVEDGAAFYAHNDETAYPSLGWTSRVRDHEGPDIDYGAVEAEGGGGQWTATPTFDADASDEGTNDSWALGEGDHDVAGQEIDAVRVNDQRAPEIAAAENEHVADYRYAYAQVIERADAWLDDFLGERSYGPADSEEAVQALVDNDLSARLREHLGLTGIAEADFDWVNLHAYYGRASSQTNKRDENGWHSFDENNVEEANRTIAVVVQSDTTAIGNHASADVIDLSEVE